ncbi:MAG: 1-deoxy-D-xylulose-5-phosphate reductoisomerase [Clostridia bacterium]|nr:1-deoxy-D-xylulose-5-phosphate reductoisomerase [Clostridia bacterium]
MNRIALIGSTGSIGRQVLSVCEKHPDKFKIEALCARRRTRPFEEQCEKFAPSRSVCTEDSKNGRDDAPALCRLDFVDTVVVACPGFAGLEYSLEAVRAGKRLALANKETLVCGGELVMPLAKKGQIVPVDSEHSAIWQCLGYDTDARFKRLILTASGGPFLGRSFSSLSDVTPEEALKHPTWNMGGKITVDSATLLNKAYEAAEAHWLFGASYDKITAVLHPQSVVHSMVEFDDGSCLAQMARPDMELCITKALSWPEILERKEKSLDFSDALSLDFRPLEEGMYPCFDLAMKCMREGGVLPTILNAASEVAVEAFLRGEIGYTDIYAVEETAVSSFMVMRPDVSYKILCAADELARTSAWHAVARLSHKK